MKLNRKNPHLSSYNRYIALANSGDEQPLTTHADRYNINSAYSTSAYSKGAVFLAQLGYIIGKDNLTKTIKKYFTDFAFKHPTPNAIIRTAEKVSGLELDWYLTDFGQTTNTIDYGIKTVNDLNEMTEITLERKQLMPMPIDLTVNYLDGSSDNFYIPLEMMRGEKPVNGRTIALADWPWVNPYYTFSIDVKKDFIASIVIDPSEHMADTNKSDNTISFDQSENKKQ